MKKSINFKCKDIFVFLKTKHTSLFSISFFFLLYQPTHQIYSIFHLFLSSHTLSPTYFSHLTFFSQPNTPLHSILLRSVWFGREVGKREIGKREFVKREKDKKYRRFDVLFGIRGRKKKK